MKLSKKGAAIQRAMSFGVIGPNGLCRTCLHSLPNGFAMLVNLALAVDRCGDCMV